MDNKVLYEETINTLLNLLKKTASNFSAAYETAYGYYNAQPLFSITSPKLALLKKVSYFSNYQIRNEMANLCYRLYTENSSNECINTSVKNVDFIGICKGVKTGYYVSMNEEYMPDLEEAKKSGIEKVVIIVLNNSLFNLSPASYEYREYKDKNMIKNITLEDYLQFLCPGEYEVFQEYIGRFNYEAEMLLGLTVSPIPTKSALENKREKIRTEFSSGFFEECLVGTFSENEIKKLKTNFIKSVFCEIPVSEYSDSFISSEWYYDLYVSTDGEMEQTAIVAGYLKSIEQFLFSMMLSKSDILKFKLRVKSNYKNDEKYVPLTRNNYTNLLTMAGNLLTSIDINYGKQLNKVYITEDIGYKTQKYLHEYFEHTRNGYFHKDNIYKRNDIEQIRKETYVAYFLIASAFI